MEERMQMEQEVTLEQMLEARERRVQMARSPCRLFRFSPATVTPPPRAPAQSQKAALDQSPSTWACPGLR